jgi:putative inorganic carbon (hco3(-)) transporter
MPLIPDFVLWGLALVMFIDYLGLAEDLAVLKVTRAATVMAYGLFAVVAIRGGLTLALASRQSRLMLGLMGLAFLSLLYAVVRSYVPAAIRAQLDYFALFVMTAALMDRRDRVKKLSFIVTIVILVLVGRNVDLLTSGERVGVFRAGSFLGDGNDFSWGMVSLMLFPLYLMLGPHGVMSRAFGVIGVAAALFGVVGTQSRGATLAVAGAALYYMFVLSRRRIASIIVIGALAGLALVLSPQSYVARVTDTRVSEDSSAQGRLRAWKASVRMALDYPLGVGFGSFNSAYGRFYVEEADAVFDFGARRWISAHSIYFKVLGEAGFIGLGLVLALLYANFKDNQACLKFVQAHPEQAGIDDRWPALLNFGLVGFAVGGAFLGGISYPHVYLLSGLTLACRRMTIDRPEERSALPVRQRVPTVPLLAPRPAVALGRHVAGARAEGLRAR